MEEKGEEGGTHNRGAKMGKGGRGCDGGGFFLKGESGSFRVSTHGAGSKVERWIG